MWRYEIALTRPRETVLNEDAGTTGADGVSGRVMTRGGVMIHYTTHACKLGHVDTWYAAERGSLMLLTRWRGADMGHADRLTCTFTEWCSLLRARAPSDRCCVHAPRRHHPIELRSIAGILSPWGPLDAQERDHSKSEIADIYDAPVMPYVNRDACCATEPSPCTC